MAFGDKLEDFPLPVGQKIGGAAGVGVGHDIAEEGGHGRAEIGAATGHGFEALVADLEATDWGAIEQASGGPVAEGAVGAGTGLITCDFKAGIGTSSRRVELSRSGGETGPSFNLGVLVQSNFGIMRSLCIAGVPVGEILAPDFADDGKRVRNAGSIICVVATDAPLLPSQISRLCKRAALGIGRVGSFAAHASGEIIIGFSTANKLPRASSGMIHAIEVLLDDACDGLYEAVVECTEEAIVNALCMADDMRGQSDHFAPALPLDDLRDILTRHRAARER